MDGRHRLVRPLRLQPLSVLFHQAKLIADHRACGGGAEADHDLRADEGELSLDPRPASSDFDRRRRFVNAPLADALEFEMFHGVRDVEIFAIQFHRVERAIEHLTRGTYEGSAAQVFLIAGNFADQRDLRVLWTFAENRLRRVFVKLAAAATLDRLAQRLHRIRFRPEWTRARLGQLHPAHYLRIALRVHPLAI